MQNAQQAQSCHNTTAATFFSGLESTFFSEARVPSPTPDSGLR